MLRARTSYGIAMEAVRGLRSSSVTTIHHAGEALDAAAWATIEGFGGVPLSYVDASLIALGRRLRIRRVYTFDGDFQRAGMEILPSR